jgi:hypothetical protein
MEGALQLFHIIILFSNCVITTAVNLLADVGAVSSETCSKGKGKGHPCTGTEALYRPYGP